MCEAVIEDWEKFNEFLLPPSPCADGQLRSSESLTQECTTSAQPTLRQSKAATLTSQPLCRQWLERGL